MREWSVLKTKWGLNWARHRLRLGLGPEDRLPGRQGPALLHPVEGLGPHHEPGQDGVDEEVVEGEDDYGRSAGLHPPKVDSNVPRAMVNPTVPEGRQTPHSRGRRGVDPDRLQMSPLGFRSAASS